MVVYRGRVAMACALLVVAALSTAQAASAVDALFRQKLGFSAADIKAFDGGAAVVRSLDTPVREELAHIAAVRVAASPAGLLGRFRDIVRFEQGPGIPQIGRFSDPPRIEDLAALTLPAPDLTALRACQPGNCDLKLSAAAMQRFRDDVDWMAPDAAEQANVIAREMILELVRAYQRNGNAALGSYEDGGEPMSVAGQFRAIMASDAPLPAPVPALFTYLNDYPQGRPPGAEDFFYWTVVDFGLKLTIRVNHVVIYPLPAAPSSPVSHVIAIKQLYASHYFFTTLELRFLVADPPRTGSDGLALVSVTRSRNDGMTGFKGLFLRPIISRRSREAVRVYLEHVKQQVERPEPNRSVLSGR
jgi:hypothetical protein